MKLLPYYLEDDAINAPGSISLADNTYVLSVDDANVISNYMGSCGVIVSEWLSNTRDALNKNMSAPTETWSDGTYFWDSLHIHYVQQYRVRLPISFVAHVKSQIRSGFSADHLNPNDLILKYEKTIGEIAKGDMSYFDDSY